MSATIQTIPVQYPSHSERANTSQEKMKGAKEVTPLIDSFFTYATNKNFSIPVTKKWINSEQKVRVQRLYTHCVMCNTERFQRKDMRDLPFGTNLYHCNLCDKKIMPLLGALIKMYPEATERAFNNHIYGLPQSKL